jgi:VacB/RNase II family 3'-5' exoribonuclease
MIARGFEPDIPAAATAQAASLPSAPPPPADGVRDLRHLLWSSIDNDDSRDLDQIEFAEATADGVRVLVGIADVDGAAPPDSPIDCHATIETTTVYTGVHVFPMLPERLSTDLTSLLEDRDRLAVVIEFTVAPDGTARPGPVYCALVRNRAQLTYSTAGPWLEGTAPPPPPVAASADLQAQLRLQNAAAQLLSGARHRLGALSFDRAEVQGVVRNGAVQGLEVRRANRASHLIEDFMIAANETMAQTLAAAGVSSIRRVVKAPERWPRMVEMAAQFGDTLPAAPDAAALSAFLQRRRTADPVHYPDVSLGILKLMGPGEYAVLRPGEESAGHFGLAAHDYSHSTAPNRRFADLVTQRLIKAVRRGAPAPYSDDQLATIARHCTLMEDAARKVQRDMNKRVAALAMAGRAGESFAAVVTGVVARKGVFVRTLDPPVEGRLIAGEHGLDVGDQIHVRLTATDPELGFIDFARQFD